MNHLKLTKANVSDFRLPFSKDRVDALTLLAAEGLHQVVLKEYPEAYPSPLFKNQSKCKVIGAKLLDYLSKNDTKTG